MITLTFETELIVHQVTLTDHKLIIDLTDGRSITVPLAWYPHLLYASAAERQNWQLLGDGYAIEWLDLDEHIAIDGLLLIGAVARVRAP